MGFECLEKSSAPVSFSIFRTIWLRDGWEMHKISAALLMLPSFRIVSMYSSCLSFIGNSLYL